MKKIIFLLLFFSSSITLQAQLQLGIKGGYDYFWFGSSSNFEDNTYDNSHNAPVFGINVATRMPSVFNVSVEADYLYRSFHMVNSNYGHGGGNYLDVDVKTGSLFLQFLPQVVLGNKIKFILYPGLSIGFVLHTDIDGINKYWTYEGNSGVDSTYHSDDSSLFTSEFPFGLIVGSGIEIPVAKNLKATVDLKYNLNFGGNQNISIMAGVAYLFPDFLIK